MIQIPLAGMGGGFVAVIDDSDLPLVQAYQWYAWKGKNHSSPYACGRLQSTDVPVYMHRLIRPDISRIDHEDGNGLNNQRDNLRPATRSQNASNRHTEILAASGYRGVHRSIGAANPWAAHICVNRHQMHLGSFPTAAQAADAYDAAAVVFYGAFARLNCAWLNAA